MDAEKLKSIIESRSKELEKEVIAIRRDLHAHPEVAYKEAETSKKVQELLKKNGIPFEVIEHNMVIATIQGKEQGKTLGIRADMDALPMDEMNDVPYKSTVPGAMHSCGHDAHVAILLGSAIILNEIRDSLKGTVKLIFQAAEEVAGGVNEIIAYFGKNGGLDRLIALHVWADIPAGHISVEPGGRMAGGIFWEVEVIGQGGHGSRPDKAKDPIKAACEIFVRTAALPSTRYNILEPCVVSPAFIRGGDALNIIPDTAKIGGTIRFFSYEAGEIMTNLVTEVAENIAKSYGVEARLKFYGHVSPIINQEDAVALGQEVARGIGGLTLDAHEPICACDCYGDLLKKFPGMYCYLGIRNEKKGIIYPQHHSKYDIDEDVMRLGCEFFAKYALAYL